MVEEELVGRRAGGRVGRWTGSAIRKPILLRRDNEQLAKLALPRSYNCTAFFPLCLQEGCAVGRPDLVHIIGDGGIRFLSKRMLRLVVQDDRMQSLLSAMIKAIALWCFPIDFDCRRLDVSDNHQIFTSW